jgi:hypothetical protein
VIGDEERVEPALLDEPEGRSARSIVEVDRVEAATFA